MTITDLADDEWIRESGFYRLPISRHHAQPCCPPDRLREIMAGDKPRDGEVSVTSGVLRKLELQTPADYYAFSILNPNRWPEPDRPALWLGRAMAAFVEGGMDEVEKHFLILPEDKPRKPTPQQIQAYSEGRATEAGIASVEFWEAVESDTRTPLTDSEITMIRDMGRVLAQDPAACAVMGGEPEITMAYQDEITGLWVLSRPDTVSFDGSLSDYKKMNTMGRPFNHYLVDRRIEQHAYEMQMALAGEAFQRLTGEWPSMIGIVAQWDAPPHHVILREIGSEALGIGRFRNRRALNRFKECLDAGYWPGPGDDVGAFQPSDHWWKRMLAEMETEGTAP